VQLLGLCVRLCSCVIEMIVSEPKFYLFLDIMIRGTVFSSWDKSTKDSQHQGYEAIFKCVCIAIGDIWFVGLALHQKQAHILSSPQPPNVFRSNWIHVNVQVFGKPLLCIRRMKK
jgi:hypothetical protein